MNENLGRHLFLVAVVGAGSDPPLSLTHKEGSCADESACDWRMHFVSRVVQKAQLVTEMQYFVRHSNNADKRI